MAKMIVDLETGTVLGIHPGLLIVDEDEYVAEYIAAENDYGMDAMEALTEEMDEAQKAAEKVGVTLSDTFDAHRRMAQRAASVQSVLEQGAKDFMAHGWDTLYNSLPDAVRSEYALVNPFTDI